MHFSKCSQWLEKHCVVSILGSKGNVWFCFVTDIKYNVDKESHNVMESIEGQWLVETAKSENSRTTTCLQRWKDARSTHVLTHLRSMVLSVMPSYYSNDRRDPNCDRWQVSTNDFNAETLYARECYEAAFAAISVAPTVAADIVRQPPSINVTGSSLQRILSNCAEHINEVLHMRQYLMIAYTH